MGPKHNVKRDLGAGDTISNECVASLVQIVYSSSSLRKYSRGGAGWGSQLMTHEVTCCDIHCDDFAFGAQTRNRRSKPAAIPSYSRSAPMDHLAQDFVLRAQLQYIDLPQTCII